MPGVSENPLVFVGVGESKKVRFSSMRGVISLEVHGDLVGDVSCAEMVVGGGKIGRRIHQPIEVEEGEIVEIEEYEDDRKRMVVVYGDVEGDFNVVTLKVWGEVRGNVDCVRSRL